MVSDNKVPSPNEHRIDEDGNESTGDPVQFPTSLRGKRVLLATESLGPINGVSRTTASLIAYLRAHDVDVAVVAPEIRSPQAKPGPLCLQVDLRMSGWPLPYNPDLTIVYPFRLDRVFERTFVPDLIYLASPASVGFQILLQSRQLRRGPPVVCNFQTDLSAYGEIMFPSPLDRYAVWMLGLVQKFLFNGPSVQTVFYPCSDISRYLRGTGVHVDKLVHLGRGVDTAMFNPERRDSEYRKELAPNGETILICVSRLGPEKGFDFLAQAAIKLADRSRNGRFVPFKLVVVGGNRNPSVQAEIQRYFLPIRDRVVFTGFLTGIPLARAYASADLFLHCSTTETFGLVVLEAMASGVPVVARDQGGPSEIVRSEKTGFLVPPHDIDGFVERVQSLCLDREMRLRFAQTSRQVALDTTWEKINNRAAGYMAAAIQEAEGETMQNEGRMRTKANWMVRVLDGLNEGIVKSVLQWVRISVAELIILGFWIVACGPLILHGTFMCVAKS